MVAAMINVGAIPSIPADPDGLEAAAGSIDGAGATLATAGSEMASTWKGLAGVYSAPEAGQLLGVMEPVRAATDDVQSQLTTVSGALRTFATDVRAVKAQMASVVADANAFVADMADEDIWNRDQGNVDTNNALLGRVDAAVAAWQDAQRRCANTLRGIVCMPPLVAEDGSGSAPQDLVFGGTAGLYDKMLHSEKGMPWGGAVHRDLPWYEDALSGSWHFVQGLGDSLWGLVDGLGTLVGVHGWDAMKSSWKGLGELGVMLSPIGSALLAVNHFTALPGLKKGELEHTATNVGKSLLAWDEWKKDPARALGTVTGNVLTAVGTDGAGAALKGTSAAARAARLARLAELTGKGGRGVEALGQFAADTRGAALGALTKAAELGKIKLGDLTGPLKGLRVEMPRVDVVQMAGGDGGRVIHVTGPRIVHSDPVMSVASDGSTAGHAGTVTHSTGDVTAAPHAVGDSTGATAGGHPTGGDIPTPTHGQLHHSDSAPSGPGGTPNREPVEHPGGHAAPGSADRHPASYGQRPPVDRVEHVSAPTDKGSFAARDDLAPRTQYQVDGRGTFITDDTGRVVHVETTTGQKGSFSVELNHPAPDTTYVVHRPPTPEHPGVGSTFTFHTNADGATVYAHAAGLENVRPVDEIIRDVAAQRRVGAQGGAGFEGSHLVAAMFGSPGESINQVAAHWTVNRGAGASMAAMERKISALMQTHPGSTFDLEMTARVRPGEVVPDVVRARIFENGQPVLGRFRFLPREHL